MARRADLVEMMVKELAKLPDEWRCFRWSWIDGNEVTEEAMEVEGAIAPLFKAGPRKGKSNWKAKDNATVRKFVVSEAKYKAWVAEWEKRTGKCCGCLGEGKELERWSVIEGATYRPCGKCKGTGNPVTQ